MNFKKLIAMLLGLALFITVAAGCSSEKGKNQVEGSTVDDTRDNDVEETPPVETSGDLIEGKDTNNGRPYNLNPVKYDSRDDKYLNGINATKLPITDEPVTLVFWRAFSSNIMQGLDECEVFDEMEKRTGVKVEFVYPPAGQTADNFNLRIASDDLPHIFSNAPEYAGGFHKAVEDGVYLELTPYYDKGLMPNMKWLRENNDQINRDMVDDEGRMFYFPVIDIVPAHPWSGLWVREDWVKELGLDMPETIEDWDVMLRAMKDAKGIAPLGVSMKSYFGIATNYMFVGSYEVGYEWITKNGKEASYGPIELGYKDFLIKMNEWYEDGLIDPDFATRDGDSYFANIANGKIGAAGLAYGDLGQIKKTGQTEDPKFSFKPVLQPTSYDGQEIHLHQDNSIVRGDRTFFTTRLVDDGLDEVAIAWQDYWYSQDGGDLCSYGPEGVSYQWKDDGEYQWIYPRLKNDEGLDFWTIYPLFKLHTFPYLRDSTSYEFEPEVFESIELWDTQDSSWLIPENINHTSDESKELTNIMTDINTYRDEMTLKFIMGQEPLSKFDNFVETIKSMNINRAIEIKSDALKRYYNR